MGCTLDVALLLVKVSQMRMSNSTPVKNRLIPAAYTYTLWSIWIYSLSLSIYIFYNYEE